ncbi:or S-antigen, C-terminal domain-containing protein [Pseudomassariella vexata]|uniref:Or S-antigen, C-terminal domain-domain-containing protein n=1 Tax=Pseudomassariella vexata TaxID=1141098 RepID=A0A1Y2DPY5_9PEZI|nr:or S-antigen, C-terminal domain-containing protein [Pseudomassariella vexata]ORY61239.1 or S-antigen, C-terminal domain-domain-containing protein [Pseudomassariella vexata]
MPSFNPFVAGRNACTLFQIRLENDFIVLRGNEFEASGQMLKGVVVLCLRESLRVEDVHLRLTGSCRLAWVEGKQTPTGIHNQKFDKTTTILKHTWPPFIGGHSNHGQTLAPGNYEWPFELLLPGDTAESVEGLHHTNISYFLKATISRGKLSKNPHAWKRLRIIRTLDPAALEFNHAMSVENIWPNKIEYSVIIPQKAVVFGSTVPLEMRFTPLLKGLEMGDITVKLIEIQEFTVSGYTASARSHKTDRDVCTWSFEVKRDDHWHDNVEETGQEGWAINKDLPLPKRLAKCIQDCNVHGIKIRHKVKLTVALKNPDGHISELRATLPVTIFISPNMPLDEEGNLVSQQVTEVTERAPGQTESSNMAPPGYGQHVLDQLYEDEDSHSHGAQTPGGFYSGLQSGMQSGINSPFYAQSRAGSSENLAGQLAGSSAVHPAALSSRLQNVSLDPSSRNTSFTSAGSYSGAATPHHPNEGEHTAESSQPHSTELSRQTSVEDHSGHTTPEHLDFPDMEELSKVPSYTTATRMPISRGASYSESVALPDYNTAMSAPGSPARTPMYEIHDPLTTITEGLQIGSAEPAGSPSRSNSSSRTSSALGFSFLHSHSHSYSGDRDVERRLRLLQSRGN